MMAPTTTIATRATNGNMRKIILIRWRFLVSAIQRTLRGDPRQLIYEQLLCIQLVLCQLVIQTLVLFSEVASLSIRVSRSLPLSDNKLRKAN